MECAFDEISDRMLVLFSEDFIPEIERKDGAGRLTLLTKGMGFLIGACKEAMPSSVWEKVSEVDWMEDAGQILDFLRVVDSQSPNAERWQFTLSDVEGDQEPGKLMLFLGPSVQETTSEYAVAVEKLIQDEEFDVQEWAHWCLLVGFLGLLLLEHLRPLNISGEFPESGTIYCIGIHDRIHLYLGIRSDGKFSPMAEWN